MTLGQQLGELFAEVVALIRQVPESVTRWAMKQHAPFDVAGDGTGPAVCPRCKVDWPCDEFMRLDRSLKQL